jgi:pimeloyl-ACP methyl ester carboxylesterase
MDPDSSSDNFWEFTFTDRIYDDIANFELVLSKTGHSKLAFVGHSEGSTTMLTSLTTNDAQWFKDRISIFIAVAPVARLENMKTTWLRILGASDLPIALVKLFGIKEWFAPTFFARAKFQFLCNYIPEVCQFNMWLITDGKPLVNDRDSFRNYMGHFPGGLSVKILDHELQIYRDERFQYFDYGTEENLEKYGTEVAPIIPVEKINGVKIAMMIGESDLLGNVVDNEWLRQQLGSNIVSYKIYDYGNSSFYVAKEIELYLKDMVELLRKYAS